MDGLLDGFVGQVGVQFGLDAIELGLGEHQLLVVLQVTRQGPAARAEVVEDGLKVAAVAVDEVVLVVHPGRGEAAGEETSKEVVLLDEGTCGGYVLVATNV